MAWLGMADEVVLCGIVIGCARGSVRPLDSRWKTEQSPLPIFTKLCKLMCE